jgi:hypothetical protein
MWNVRNPAELVALPQIITFYFFQGFWSAMGTVTLDKTNTEEILCLGGTYLNCVQIWYRICFFL